MTLIRASGPEPGRPDNHHPWYPLEGPPRCPDRAEQPPPSFPPEHIRSTVFAIPHPDMSTGTRKKRSGFYISEDEAVDAYMACGANHQVDAQEGLKDTALRHFREALDEKATSTRSAQSSMSCRKSWRATRISALTSTDRSALSKARGGKRRTKRQYPRRLVATNAPLRNPDTRRRARGAAPICPACRAGRTSLFARKAVPEADTASPKGSRAGRPERRQRSEAGQKQRASLLGRAKRT